MIQLLDGFVQEGMSQCVSASKGELTIDGQEFKQYHDPFTLVARNMLQDIDSYN